MKAYDRLRGRREPSAPPSALNGAALSREPLLLTVPVLELMRPIEGWLSDREADLLLAATAHALRTYGPEPALVEIGSYCGRSTVVIASAIARLAPSARLYAIDPHEGDVGDAAEGIEHTAPTLEKFRASVAQAGLAEHVELLHARSYEVVWDRPIGFLFVDGLHDYDNCKRDFEHFADHVLPGGYVAFHDYSVWPGVTRYVDEVLAAGGHERVAQADSVIVLRRLA